MTHDYKVGDNVYIRTGTDEQLLCKATVFKENERLIAKGTILGGLCVFAIEGAFALGDHEVFLTVAEARKTMGALHERAKGRADATHVVGLDLNIYAEDGKFTSAAELSKTEIVVAVRSAEKLA